MTKRPTLTRTAAILCGNPAFQQFLASRFRSHWLASVAEDDKGRAADTVRTVCEVRSRSDLDKSTAAALRYNHLIGIPFSAHLRSLRQ